MNKYVYKDLKKLEEEVIRAKEENREAKEFIIEEWDYIKENNENNLEQLINELKIKFRNRISKY